MKQVDKQLVGTILEIQRMSTEDGPGIRTTVFFKGCSLRCTWCHNPESINAKKELQWLSVSCIGCKSCILRCPNNALQMTSAGILIDRKRCVACGTCAHECPTASLQLLGHDWKADDLVKELIKDSSYFRQSGGGVTLSGGEAALQYEFCAEVFALLKKEGINCAIDTSGNVPPSALNAILPLVDLILYDIKEIDPKKHKKFTGASNENILENAKVISEFIKTHIRPPALWIRTPIIPGATATKENIEGIGKFIEQNLRGVVQRWDLCAFNNLCRDKYTRLGLDWEYANTPLLTKEEMEYFATIAQGSGVPPSIVKWSGSTRMDDEGEMHCQNPTTLKKIHGC